jgi:hypothetical protein
MKFHPHLNRAIMNGPSPEQIGAMGRVIATAPGPGRPCALWRALVARLPGQPLQQEHGAP